MRPRDTIALITGAASGIGAATARFARERAAVAIAGVHVFLASDEAAFITGR